VNGSTIGQVIGGCLIAIDGIDGAGKTTQASRLCRDLASAGLDVVASREPTAGPAGQKIRSLAESGLRATPEEELRLFQEDREQHVGSLVVPALQAGKCVVLDRYFLSTVAYQGARGLDHVALLAECEVRFPIPNLAVFLDVDAEVGVHRVEARGKVVAVFERVELLREVAKVFRGVERPYVARVDGHDSEDEVASAIEQCVSERLQLLG